MKILKVLAVCLIVGGSFAIVGYERVEAVQWTPRTVNQIKGDIRGNEYKIVWGDTLSGIGQAVNISVKKLADMNKITNVDLIYAGNKLVIDGSMVIFQNSNGDTVAKSIIKNEDKIISDRPIGNLDKSTFENGTIAPSIKNSIEIQEKGASDDTVNNKKITTKKEQNPTQSEVIKPGVPEDGSIQISPSIPQAPKVPSIVKGYIGNSGEVFDTGKEAISFGEKQSVTNDNIKGYNLLTIEYSDGSIKYTVDFY